MTRTEAQRYVALTAKQYGPPTRGTFANGGILVPMTDDPNSPGWTHGGESIYERDDEPGVYDAPAAAKLGDVSNAERLTSPERTELALLIGKATLP